MTKWLCRQCNWTGTELLRAPNPFEPEFDICGCPVCKDVADIVGACEVADCANESTIGAPTDDGYKRFCSKHFVEGGVVNFREWEKKRG